MKTKLTTTHDRITLVIREGDLLAARVTWGRSGTRIAGEGTESTAQFTRQFLCAMGQAAHHLNGRTYGEHAAHLQALAEAAPDRAALLAAIGGAK